MTQAGLLAAQTVAMLVVMARVPGGVVALQIALNFYFLPLALVATPVGLAVLPRLARLYHRGELATFWDAYARGVMLALFLVVPASAGYVALAQPIARVVGVGQMATPHGYDLIAQALAMLSLGLAGAAVFFISTQASYARDDARRPLRSMAVQTVVCLLLIGLAVAFTSDATLVKAVAAAYAVGCLVGAMHLFATVTAGARTAARSCLRAAGRVLIGTVAMLPALHRRRAHGSTPRAGSPRLTARRGRGHAQRCAGLRRCPGPLPCARALLAQVGLPQPRCGDGGRGLVITSEHRFDSHHSGSHRGPAA